jgi:hypothetical protein
MKPATPLPWHRGLKQAEQIVYDAKGWAIANATVYHGEADKDECKANAAYIAHACNAYPRLVEAINAALKELADLDKRSQEAEYTELDDVWGTIEIVVDVLKGAQS